MVEIPILNGASLGKPWESDLAGEYCRIMREIFFTYGPCNDTPEFTHTYPFGFLLFTNAHPEMRAFMARPDAWDFLNALTRERLFIFSHKLEEGNKVLSREQEEAMTLLFKTFRLGDIPLTPYLVLCDFTFHHKPGREPYEHHYDTKLAGFYSLAISNMESSKYIGAFRDSLGKAIAASRLVTTDRPAQHLASTISRVQLAKTFGNVVAGLFREDFSKKLAAAWTLLSWRPRKIDS
jgi:hypothetical protein